MPLGATANAGESISHVSEAIWLASAVKENKSSLVVNSIGIVNIPYSYSLNNLDTLKVFQVSFGGLDSDISIRVSKPSNIVNDDFYVRWNGIELSDKTSYLLDREITTIEIENNLMARTVNVQKQGKNHQVEELTLQFTAEWN